MVPIMGDVATLAFRESVVEDAASGRLETRKVAKVG
jgi:hypothetical protein